MSSEIPHRINVTVDAELGAYLCEVARKRNEPLASVVRSLLIRAQAMENMELRILMIEKRLKEMDLK